MEKKNMNLLKIVPIFAADQKTLALDDFYYTMNFKEPNITEINKRINHEEIKEFNPANDVNAIQLRTSKLYTVFSRLSDILGINKEIKDMEARFALFKGTLQKDKLERYRIFASLIVHFCGILLSHFYWERPLYKRYADEDDLLNFVIRVGNMLLKEVNQMIAKQYNLVDIVNTELKKVENTVDKRKGKKK